MQIIICTSCESTFKTMGTFTRHNRICNWSKNDINDIRQLYNKGYTIADIVKKYSKKSVTFALRGSNIKCKYLISRDLRIVNIDEAQISQVINNLILNAEQAMLSGGEIEVKVENVLIEKSIYREINDKS